MKRPIKRQRRSRAEAERVRLYALAFEFADALWHRDYMQSETREEFEEIGRLAQEARSFARQLPKGKFRKLYSQALERRFHGIFWALPNLPPCSNQVEEDPIGKQFSDDCRSGDNSRAGEAA